MITNAGALGEITAEGADGELGGSGTSVDGPTDETVVEALEARPNRPARRRQAREALRIARELARFGVPIFVAHPALDSTGRWDPHGGSGDTGYVLPSDWQHTIADPAVVDTWRPGDALCAVMGHVLDALDFDPRAGGHETADGLAAAGLCPAVLGSSSTPSVGRHDFVRSLGVGSRNALRPGLDVKGGRPDGTSRGFVFIAPTVRASKVDDEIRPYRWTVPPMLQELDPADDSGAAIAEMITNARGPAPLAGQTADPTDGPIYTGPAHAELPTAERERLHRYTQTAAKAEIARLQALARPWHDGAGWDRGTYEPGCNLFDLADSRWSSLSLERAIGFVRRYAPRDDRWGEREIEQKIRSALIRPSAGRGRPYPDDPAVSRSWAGRVASSEDSTTAAVNLAVATVSADFDAALWDSRPVLRHIRDFARARMCSPWAVLGVMLVRVVVATPPQVVLPAIIGSHAPLNLYVALVGPSGSGKGAAESAAIDALDVGGPVEVASLGSGEGIGHLFAHREKAVVVRDREAVLFTVPEVDGLTALGARQGSTLLPQLRQAWSGERLGFAYADRAKSLPIERHTYRLGLVLGVQPGRAAPLLEDADGGTPQRFLWLPTTDPDAPDEADAAPERWTLASQLWRPASAGPTILAVPPIAVDTIRGARLARLRGDGEALDGHALLARLKTAAALSLLDGRRAIADDDWDLAGVVMAMSDLTRAAVVRHLAERSREANVQRGRAEGIRAAVATEAVEELDELAAQRVASAILRRLQDSGELARNDARRALASRDRRHFDEALDRLVAAGQVVVTETDHGERLTISGGGVS